MFKSDLLEGLSKIHFAVPLFIFVPAIIFFIYMAFSNGITVISFIGFFALGIAVWTATEYVLHRYIFHYVPTSKWGLRLHFIFHGVHHDYPRDSKRLVMVPTVSIPLAALFYGLFSLIIHNQNLWSFFAGFLLGYLVYDMMHYALHHANFKSSFWKKIKDHHMLHHYADPTKGYGVSTKIWDTILDSDFQKK
jgi:sterol desaturase/sphingolipid hydroxylase (fatty acid hydroxylase superfamily)